MSQFTFNSLSGILLTIESGVTLTLRSFNSLSGILCGCEFPSSFTHTNLSTPFPGFHDVLVLGVEDDSDIFQLPFRDSKVRAAVDMDGLWSFNSLSGIPEGLDQRTPLLRELFQLPFRDS